MAQAVAGILLYPSLDKSNECIGVSSSLRQPGSVACDSSDQYKLGVTVLVLMAFFGNVATSAGLFLRRLIMRREAAAGL